MTHQKLVQTIERRGFSREIVESLLDAGADRDYFADRERLDSLAQTLTTPVRTVTVHSDEEHSRFQLEIDDRSSGYPRHHTIGVDFATPEYRSLLANKRDVPTINGTVTVSTQAAAAEESEAPAGDGETVVPTEPVVTAADLARRGGTKSRPPASRLNSPMSR